MPYIKMDDYERQFMVAGKWGRYQMIISILIICTSAVGPIILLTVPINQTLPSFSYLDTNNQQVRIENRDEFCEKTYKAISYQDISKNIEITSSLQTWSSELKFVCFTKQIFSLTGTVFFLGSVASNIAFIRFPDRYGRKKIFLLFNFVSFIALFQMLFLQSYMQILVCAFLMGITSLNLSIGAVYLSETVDRSYSGLAMGITNAMFPFVGLVNLGVMYLFQSWKVVYIFIIIVNVITNILGYFFLKESPTWLNANKKQKELNETFEYIAKINGTSENLKLINQQIQQQRQGNNDDCEFLSLNSNSGGERISNEHLKFKRNDLRIQAKPAVEQEEDEDSMDIKFNYVYSVSDLFTFPSLRMKSVKNILLWMISGFSFFGILLNLEGLTGSIVIDSIVTYTAEFIAEIISGYLALIYGRKLIIFYSFLLSSVGSFAFIFLTPFSKIVGVAFLFFASLGIASAFNVLYIYSPELYPTNIKNLAINTFSLLNRISAGLVPTFIAFFPNLLVIIGSLCGVGCLVVLQLPESRDYNPGNEVEEVDEMNNDIIDVPLGFSPKSSTKSLYLCNIDNILKST